VVELGYLSREKVEKVFNVRRMTEGGIPAREA
jgi:hypothetical protein